MDILFHFFHTTAAEPGPVLVDRTEQAPVPAAVADQAKGDAVVLRRRADGTYFQGFDSAQVNKVHGLSSSLRDFPPLGYDCQTSTLKEIADYFQIHYATLTKRIAAEAINEKWYFNSDGVSPSSGI
jgi:hypothetical protein